MCIPDYMDIMSFSNIVKVTDNMFKFCGYYCGRLCMGQRLNYLIKHFFLFIQI